MFPANNITHHGAVQGVTGSCHELHYTSCDSILIDCGLFQGADASLEGRADATKLHIDFDISAIRALVVTHVHIDHVGRIPYLMAAGFNGPIYCSQASSVLLPLVLEDAIKVGFTRNKRWVEQFVAVLKTQLHPLPFGQWQSIDKNKLAIKLKPAGHILGSAYVECRLRHFNQGDFVSDANAETKIANKEYKVIFSGDLGAPYAPLLPAPKSPYSADMLVLESTYGNRTHPNRRQRRQQFEKIIKRALSNRGVLLIPAFSIGRTQELLYELEELIHRNKTKCVAKNLPWQDLEIILDSPLAANFTEAYRQLKPYWDKEALRKKNQGRHPLSFEQITTIDTHKDHQQTVKYLQKNARPCIVIAASGMCEGGRVVNYLKALLEDSRHDVLFVGYQANDTVGQRIQRYGPTGGYVELDGQRYTIRAGVHTISGYSAHADQKNLINFVKRMCKPPQHIRLVHGEKMAKKELKHSLQGLLPEACISIP